MLNEAVAREFKALYLFVPSGTDANGEGRRVGLSQDRELNRSGATQFQEHSPLRRFVYVSII
jgi:hypothetical protein